VGHGAVGRPGAWARRYREARVVGWEGVLQDWTAISERSSVSLDRGIGGPVEEIAEEAPGSPHGPRGIGRNELNGELVQQSGEISVRRDPPANRSAMQALLGAWRGGRHGGPGDCGE
jgi:hypothetical protein